MTNLFAFSAVILALIATTVTYWIASVKHRWLATQLNTRKPSMEMIVKQGEKAGVAYRMKDGSMVYVPEGKE